MQRVILNDGECNKEKHMVFLRLTVERLYGILGNVAAEVKLTTLALELSLSLFDIDSRSLHIPSGEQVKLEIMPIRSVLVEYWRPVASGKSRHCL